MTKRELQRLRRLKDRKGLTYKDLAEAAGCNEVYASQLLQGHKPVPKWKTVVWDRIVKVLEEA